MQLTAKIVHRKYFASLFYSCNKVFYFLFCSNKNNNNNNNSNNIGISRNNSIDRDREKFYFILYYAKITTSVPSLKLNNEKP